ncbi:UNVERIFIED_ORG: type 1 fimbria pilin [Buttiauxella agrestis ATCC 33320]
MNLSPNHISFAVLFLFSSICSAAGCQLSSGTLTENIDIGEVLVQRDVAVGNVLYKKVIPASAVTIGSCSDGAYVKSVSLGDLQYLNGTNDLFQSGIEGVGIRLEYGNGDIIKSSNSVSTGPSTLKDEDSIVFSLIKTSPIEPGRILPRDVFSLSYSSNTEGTVVAKKISLSGGVIAQASCQVQTPSVIVPMGGIDRKLLKGINSTAGTRDFHIGLDCSKNTNVNIIFSPLTNVGTNIHDLRGVIEPEGGDGAASGVGIQLMFGGSPVGFDTLILVGKTPNEGIYNIPLQARYIQFSSVVNPGTINAMAKFTLIYQ